MNINRYAKAIVGAVIAGLGATQVALADSVITGTEWVQIASATIAALGLVWGVQNAPMRQPADSLADPVDPAPEG